MRLSKLNQISLLTSLFLFVAFMLIGHPQTAYAASAITIAEVNFEDEEIVIQNNGNTKIFFATDTDAAKGNWDVLATDLEETPTGIVVAKTTRLDFSWVAKSADTVIVIKGGDDKSAVQKRVRLIKRTTKLDISINYANMSSLRKDSTIATLVNIMSTAGDGKTPINFQDLEWKKGEGGKWKSVDLLTVSQIEKYQVKGTDLYFRMKAINDVMDDSDLANVKYPDGTKGRRASTETKLKIAKKATPTVVGVDGGKFTADIKAGKEYRVTIGTDQSKWIKIEDKAIRNIGLSEIAKKLGDLSDGITDPYPEMLIEIRSYATSKTAASKITEVKLAGQRILNPSLVIEAIAPNPSYTGDMNIYITYMGNKNISITIPSATTTEPYEYTVVKPGETLDIKTASWSTISKNTAAKVATSKALDEARIYIRKKEIKSMAKTKTTPAVGYQLASTVVSHMIHYPSVPVVHATNIVYVKGMENAPLEFNITLNRAGNNPFETQVRSVKVGNQELRFTQVLTPDITDTEPLDVAKVYTIKVTLDPTSLAGMSNTYNKALNITFVNGSVDKSSVKITVKQPTDVVTLTPTLSKGSVAGTIKAEIVSALTPGNVYGYYFSTTEVTKVYQESLSTLPTYTVYKSGDDIVASPGYLVLLEVNPVAGTISKFKCVEITASDIAQ